MCLRAFVLLQYIITEHTEKAYVAKEPNVSPAFQKLCEADVSCMEILESTLAESAVMQVPLREADAGTNAHEGTNQEARLTPDFAIRQQIGALKEMLTWNQGSGSGETRAGRSASGASVIRPSDGGRLRRRLSPRR